MKTKTVIRLFTLILLLAAGRTYAGIIPYYNLISTPNSGTPAVTTGTATAVSTVSVAGGGVNPHTDRMVEGVLTFAVNHQYPKIFSPSDIKIEVDIRGWSDETALSPDVFNTLTMEIADKPGDLTYPDKQNIMISGVRKYEAKITKVWVNGVLTTILPANLTLKLELFVDRYYDFTANATSAITMNAVTTIDYDCDEIDDQMVLSWPPMVGAEEYQLEWMYVNYYGETALTEIDPENLSFDFKRNSTRITTTETSYPLTLAFDKGYICYRVRAIGRSTSDLTKVIFGVWSETSPLSAIPAPDAGTLDLIDTKYKNDIAYEGNKNWQYSTTYAEEGKKKEVVSFFDGSLRNRQMVTKINTDNNTIVGETIYDHHGRAAVQVLPVPVDDPSCAVPGSNAAMKYYPGFTQDGSGNEYTQDKFDIGDGCVISTEAMGTDNGAAHYYSSDNPNQAAKQGYVPDAEGYPFTQVEYMPDNTGRIRRQGGVGDDFKLGSGHETKYYYGHPSQLQLDRMFGSEVGDYSHYQKNMVVDPNGQTSVSYLDQEGRVIATSLAGNAPGNLIPLEDAESGVVLTEDLLAKNNLGVSAVNKISQNGKQKKLNETMLISAETEVTITYDLDVNSLNDPCFAENVCFSCIYDLTINIIDECGVDRTEELGFDEQKTIGNFTVDESGKLVFNTNCTVSDFDLPAIETIVLQAGSYQVIKTLTVNEQALEYYIESYLDPEINTCIKTLEDFETEYLENTNFEDCEPVTDCAACLEEIGTAEAFIANGLGTMDEYNTAVEACTAPCETTSMSEVQLQMLLLDMSPGGQYAEYLSPAGAYEPDMFPVSIFNSSNVLPKSSSGTIKTWRGPKLIVDGIETGDGYFEEDHVTRSKIVVQPVFTAGVLSGSVPAALDLGDIYQDLISGEYYIYPEKLADDNLFINTYWKESWAHSLVKYHPEFPMYQIYSGYTKPVTTGDAYTSESFDDLLRNTSTYADAVTKGLVTGGGTVNNWFATSSSIPWDPFVVYSSGYGGYGALLSSKFSSYSSGFSMVQIASATTRCENTMLGASTLTIASCSNFGAGSDVEILDKEWNKLVGLYLSAKLELQSQRATVLTVTDPSYWGYNACIGNTNFDPLENDFLSFSLSFSPFSQYINPVQPCNFARRYNYEHKVKRYPAATDYSVDYNNAAYQHYLMTGQSPIAANLQYFLNEAVFEEKLTDASFTASDLGTFSGLYLAMNNNVPATVPTTTWTQTALTTTNLAANLTSSDPTKAISLTRPATLVTVPATTTTAAVTASYDWDDITSLHGLHYTGTSGPNKLFEITANVELSGVQYTVLLTGSTTYDIGDYEYEEECHPNDLATDISALMHVMASTNNLNSTTAVSIGTGTNYESLSTPLIRAQATSGGTVLYWKYDAGLPGFKIDATGSSTLRLELKITGTGGFSLSNLGNIKAFSGITYTGTPNSHTFVMHGLDALGAPLADLECTAIKYSASSVATNLAMGSCALPQPAGCEGPQYTNMQQLIDLLFNTLSTQSPVYPGYDIFASSAMTPELLAQFPAELTNSYSSSNSVLEDGIYHDEITIYMKNTCPIVISNANEDQWSIYDVTSIISSHVYGDPDEWGNYHSFYLIVDFAGELKEPDTIFVKSCFPVKICETTEITDTEAIFPTGVFEDPCTDYLTSIAYANALNAYNNYLDSLRTYISEKYIAHCMGAVEKLTRSYTDNEYHRTLYYYDQAGNLVKTIPPEGVQLLNITSDTDPEELLVKADRVNQTHLLLTQHRMATIYEYNSLNQLVKQAMPDHDPLNIWEITMPNGLQSGLTTTAIQMVNANTGYLSGWATISGKVRGFLYRTDNGGSNWVKMNNTVASDLKKIQMVSSTIGYAVGSSGVALKTEDGGVSWDMLNLYGNSVVADLNDLYFSSTTVGRFVGKNGVEVTTSDGGSTFSVTATLMPTGYAGNTIDAIRTIEPFGSSFMYVITMNNAGTLYDIIAIGTATNTWVAQPIQGADYHAIHFYDANNGIIAGADGNLVAAYVPTTGASYVQTNLQSGINHKILRVFFVNANRGVALVQDGSNKALMYTIDKGATWTTIEGAQSTYSDLQLSAQTFNTSIELIAVGTDARTERIVMTSSILPLMIDQTNYLSPQLLDFTTAQIVEDVAGRRIIAGTSDGKVYYSNLIGNGTDAVTYTLVGTLPGGYAKKMLLSYFSSTNGITGIIMSSNGRVYPITRANASPSYSISSSYLGNATATFVDITGTGNVTFGFNTFANRIYRIDLSSSGAVATLLSNGVAGTQVITALGVSQGGRVTYIGEDGVIYTSATDWSTGNPGGGWVPHSNLRMMPINDIHFISGDDAVAVGNNGTLLKRLTFNSVLTYMITPVNLQNDLKAITPNGSNYLIAGGKGLVAGYVYSSDVISPMILTNGQLTTTYFSNVTFNAVGVSGTNAYVAGTNGTVLYSPNTLTNFFTFTSSQHQVDFNGLGIVPGQSGSYVKMYAVGNNSKIYRFNGTSGIQIKQVFSDELYDVHFANVNLGAVAGKGYFVRQTTDGGNTWKIVLPNTTAQLALKINKVWTKSDGFTLIGGNAYLAKVVNGIASIPLPLSQHIRDIQFAANSPLEGWAAVDNRIWKLTLTPSGVSDYTIAVASHANTGYAINTVHVFENGGVLAAGASGYVGYMKPGAVVSTPWVLMSPGISASIVYKDIFFHDDATGYLVGSNGTDAVIKRTSHVSYANVATREIFGIHWINKTYTGDGIVTSASNVSSINAIAFSTKSHGLWGGSYASGFTSTNNTSYVRKIQDESSEFSSQFFYDKLGRLVVSQNSRQYAASPRKYSYSLYDALGRVYEAGEKTENTSGELFTSIFGTIVNDLYNPSVIDDAKLDDWITGDGPRKEVTRSYYDVSVITGLPVGFTPDSKTQRKRITHVTYEAIYDGDDQTFDHATHYDYDIHGNVKTLLQDNKKMSDLDVNLATQRFKLMDYVYDLISGNVHRVSYQTGKADQWHHAYTYDADNRITEARTSQTTPFIDPVYGYAVMMNETFGPYWDKEASYEYYDHGPLARTELGSNRVQGMDYTYTLQGWMKGVNATALDAAKDPGNDGASTTSAAKDAYSFGLHYNHSDYASIGGGNPFGVQGGSDDLSDNSDDLYNGNIARMVTTITNPTTRDVLPLGNAYRYDQLNRIKESKSFTTFNSSTYNWNTASTYDFKYYNAFTYDRNGNIMTQVRADESGSNIDELGYNYEMFGLHKVSNRLYSVDDAIGSGSFPDDIDDMAPIAGVDINTGSHEMVYDEGGEWSSGSTGVTANLASAVDPKTGTKCATFDNMVDGGQVAFVRSSPMSVSGYNYVTFFIRNRKAVDPANNMRVTYAGCNALYNHLSYQLWLQPRQARRMATGHHSVVGNGNFRQCRPCKDTEFSRRD